MPALTTIPGVELARVGTWATSTMLWDCTPAQLADAVKAAQDPTFRSPVVKLGHVDDRFDGQPAVGRVENLRTSPDGLCLIGDLVGVPAWLAEVMASAYPSRSVEMNLDVITASGQKYAAVLTGLALLGVTAPAIESLADIAALYEQPTGVEEWVAASAVAATALPAEPAVPVSFRPTLMGAPMTTPTPDTTADPAVTAGPPVVAAGRVAAAASIEDLRNAFYDWRDAKDTDHGSLDDWAWICEVWTDSLIVDDDEGRLWRVTWTETDGAFTFGVPQRVTRTYTPVADTVAARAAADMHRPVRYDRGRVTAGAETHREPPAVSDIPTLTQSVRERLGLGAEVSDDAVLAALDERLTAQQTPPPAGDEPATTEPAPQGIDTAALERLIEDRVAAATAKYGEKLTEATTELAQIKASAVAKHKDQVLAAAVQAGKIAPADLDKWSKDYDEAPAVIERVLSDMAAGSRVPVLASTAGVVGGEPTNDDDAFYAALFGSTAKAGA